MKVFTLWKFNRKRKSRLATVAGSWEAKRRLDEERKKGQRVFCTLATRLSAIKLGRKRR